MPAAARAHPSGHGTQPVPAHPCPGSSGTPRSCRGRTWPGGRRCCASGGQESPPELPPGSSAPPAAFPAASSRPGPAPSDKAPGMGCLALVVPASPAHEAAAQEQNGNGARQTRCSGANEWSLGRGRKEVGVWGDLKLVTESTGWTGRRLAESALAEAHAPTHLGFLTAIQSPAGSPAWTGTVGARALGPGAGPGEVYTSSRGRERAQGLRGGFWNSSSSPYPSGGCHTPRLHEAAGPCIG